MSPKSRLQTDSLHMMRVHSKNTDADFMSRALQLANLGLFTTDPNPRVGCLVVKDGRIVGKGWHRRAGEAHAEIEALRQAGDNAKGATVYVTLEPCCHSGKTPPCTEALISAGVARVLAAMEDPNPQVAGQGFKALTNAGIEVECGILQSAAQELNRGFCKRMYRGTPYVFSKLAMSMDGRTAMPSGESQWITSGFARLDVYRLRAQSSAILTGIDTVLADDPALTARIDDPEVEVIQPVRIVLDTHLRISADAAIAKKPGEVWILTASPDVEKTAKLKQQGFTIVRLPAGEDGRMDLSVIMEYLGQQGINELMVEAGATLNGALLKAGLVNEWIVYMAPCILGDEARGLVCVPDVKQISDRYDFWLLDTRRVGSDLRLRYRIE